MTILTSLYLHGDNIFFISNHSINTQQMIYELVPDLSSLVKPTVQNRMNLREFVQPGPFMALGLLVEKGDYANGGP